MAKLCSSLGTSPNTSFFNELAANSFSEDFYINPDPLEFLEDLPSIYSDVHKIESDCFAPNYGDHVADCGLGDGLKVMEIDVKPEIRNNDLMWSAQPPSSLLSTSASSVSSDMGGISAAVPLSAITGNTENIQQQSQQQHSTCKGRSEPTLIIAKKISSHTYIKQEIKQEPNDDFEQHLKPHNIPNKSTTTTTTMSLNSMQNIPPGTSLLRKSNPQQQQHKKLPNARLCGNISIHISKKGDQLLLAATNTMAGISNSPSLYQRPDTPHSLDDDCSAPTEFRHNVDLRACLMGSNNISLTSDPSNFIQNVSQELQDTSKKEINTRLISTCSLSEVLDVINSGNSESSGMGSSISSSSSSQYSHNNTSAPSLRSYSMDSCDSDEESTAGSTTSSILDHDMSYGAGGVSPVSSQDSNIGSAGGVLHHHYIQHSDHSYTRCKDGMDDLGTNLETPSDSEEEIDVVSINDKKLPTNPSDKDRRALQTKVAHKFNASRIVKTANGLRTIPPRRRGSYEFPYTPASNSPVKSVNSSRFPSPSSTPCQNQYTTKYVHHHQQMLDGTPINILDAEKSRKRLLVTTANCFGSATTINGSNVAATTIINGIELFNRQATVMPPNKKHRGKKSKHLVPAVQMVKNDTDSLKRLYSLDESADTIEKRNLHNDMERQRRIGLKNLFEALKKQIPSIKDKERAPKVNILREAAKLCEALTREDNLLMEHKAKLKEEFKRNQELLIQLKAQHQHLRN